jgi:hypothetical protein
MYHLVTGLLRAECALTYTCPYCILAYAQEEGGFPYGNTPRITPSATPFGHCTFSLFAVLFVYSLAVRYLLFLEARAAPVQSPKTSDA